MVIDLPSDKGLAHFHSISRILSLPEFVKQADFTEQVETNDLPREAFADQLDRKFPIHTKTAAYLSYAYFRSQKGNMSDRAADRCLQGFQKAGEYWDLDSEFKQIEKSMTKKAEVKEGQFALTHLSENFFPVNTPSEIMKAAFDLERNKGNFDYALRSQAAKNIMKAASKAGLPLTVLAESIHKMAGCGITTKTAALLELTARWNNEKRSSLAEPLYTCMEALSQLKSELIGGEVCEKIAAIIDQYDHLTAGQTTFPEDVLFAFTKQAADKLAGSIVTTITGASYRVQDLEKAADAFGVLGKDIVSALQNMDGTMNQVKIAELMDTLPRIDAEVLQEALQSMDVHPIQLDKVAMVSEVVGALQTHTLTTIRPKIEKRSSILQRMEAQDPMIKRALDVMRRMKTAEDDNDGAKSDKCSGGKCDKPNAPRKLKGLFAHKAPNETTHAPVK